eukprot:GHVT01080916.1.p1 GENE.GHVT01080916.1~~GHVT01080916.1.p1  ORF type:complete len:251 (-),score=42.37 GHVT01080916.1:1172-1924(-)
MKNEEGEDGALLVVGYKGERLMEKTSMPAVVPGPWKVPTRQRWETQNCVHVQAHLLSQRLKLVKFAERLQLKLDTSSMLLQNSEDAEQSLRLDGETLDLLVIDPSLSCDSTFTFYAKALRAVAALCEGTSLDFFQTLPHPSSAFACPRDPRLLSLNLVPGMPIAVCFGRAAREARPSPAKSFCPHLCLVRGATRPNRKTARRTQADKLAGEPEQIGNGERTHREMGRTHTHTHTGIKNADTPGNGTRTNI